MLKIVAILLMSLMATSGLQYMSKNTDSCIKFESHQIKAEYLLKTLVPNCDQEKHCDSIYIVGSQGSATHLLPGGRLAYQLSDSYSPYDLQVSGKNKNGIFTTNSEHIYDCDTECELSEEDGQVVLDCE